MNQQSDGDKTVSKTIFLFFFLFYGVIIKATNKFKPFLLVFRCFQAIVEKGVNSFKYYHMMNINCLKRNTIQVGPIKH